MKDNDKLPESIDIFRLAFDKHSCDLYTNIEKLNCIEEVLSNTTLLNRISKLDIINSFKWYLAHTLTRLKWQNATDRPPKNDEDVIVIADGKYGNTEFHNAILLASYSDGEWVLTDYPESVNVKIKCWRYLPEIPSEIRMVI